MLPLRSALSAYLLKSLRPDNGSAAKITLLGPGRAGFPSPYPRPQPILLQPWPCRAPRSPSPGRLPPAPTACTCAWLAPPSLSAPGPLLAQPPDPDQLGSVVTEGSAGLLLLASWELCVGGSLRGLPNATSAARGHMLEVGLTLPRRPAPPVVLRLSPPRPLQPPLETYWTESLLWGWLGGRGGRAGQAAPPHRAAERRWRHTRREGSGQAAAAPAERSWGSEERGGSSPRACLTLSSGLGRAGLIFKTQQIARKLGGF